MMNILWGILSQLQGAFSHKITFMWFCSAAMGLCSGRDQIGGVCGIVRNLGLSDRAYHSLLRVFGSGAVNHGQLAQRWMSLVMSLFEANLLSVAGRRLFIVDATKVAKTGRKMPGIQGMKDTVNDCWMRGHYFESPTVVARGMRSFFPIPVASTLFHGQSNDDTGNLVDRCLAFIQRYPQVQGGLLVGDAWYSKSKLIVELARSHALGMVTRVSKNVVAYESHIQCPFDPKIRGRKKKYGKKIKLMDLFQGELTTWTIQGNLGEEFTVHGWVQDLLWKPIGMMVRFVGISHPEKGFLILLCSDVSLDAKDIAQAYVYRFWIEVAFHNAKSMIGSFTYRFWLKSMEKLPKFPKAINFNELPSQLKKKTDKKIAAFELFVTAEMIAQGLLVYLALNHGTQVTAGAKFWLRTKRGDESSERIAAAYVKLRAYLIKNADFSGNLREI